MATVLAERAVYLRTARSLILERPVRQSGSVQLACWQPWSSWYSYLGGLVSDYLYVGIGEYEWRYYDQLTGPPTPAPSARCHPYSRLRPFAYCCLNVVYVMCLRGSGITCTYCDYDGDCRGLLTRLARDPSPITVALTFIPVMVMITMRGGQNGCDRTVEVGVVEQYVPHSTLHENGTTPRRRRKVVA